MVKAQEKTSKVKKILTGLVKVKNHQKEAEKKKKVRKYIKLTGKILRTSLWVVPLISGLVSSTAEAAEEEDVSDDDFDISDELEILNNVDPEIVDAVADLFNELDTLGDLLDDEVLDSIVEQIDPNELNIEDINIAEEMVDTLCRDLERANF